MTVTYNSKYFFVEACFQRFNENIKSYGVSISSEGIVSIYALLNTFYDALEGNLAPKVYLNTLPPGFGKTEAIASFLKVWKENGFHPAGGILVGLQTKNEIAALINRLGLTSEEVAVLTRDDEINALGGDNHNAAPVLITTQQMIIKRTADRRFVKATDFFYKDGTRSLRIWDESFVLAQPITLSLYELRSLPARLYRRLSNLADQIDAFSTQLRDAEDGDIIFVPVAIGEIMPAMRKIQQQGGLNLSVTDKRLLEKLELASGRGLLVKAGAKNLNHSLIGASRPLPNDLLPVIVTDASGRVRGTYDLMDQARGNLVRLPSAAADYRNVKIYLMQHASGKDALADHIKSWPVFRHVVAEMLRRPGRWLVISNKADHQQDVKAALEEALGGSVKFDFLHWGVHHGTNAFKDVENIVVIGSYFYLNDAYPALAIAATGLGVDQMQEYDNRTFRAAEFKHNMYQAILRGSARKSDGGVASPCNVFIVASPNNNAAKLLAQTFPGASIESWGAQKTKITGHEKTLINTLDILLPLGVQEVTKKEIAQHAGFTTPQELHRQLKRPYVLAYLARERIKVATKKLYRAD